MAKKRIDFYDEELESPENNKRRNKKKGKKSKKDNKIAMANKQIINITYIFLLLFICMIAYFVKFLIHDSDELINNSYNKREEVLTESVVRGSILSRDGEVLAETIVGKDGEELRNYPYGPLFAHSVGYSTHGKTGVELLANYKLLTSDSPVFEYAVNEIKGKKNQGDNVVTTLDVDITKAIYYAFGSYDGAAIAINPDNGEILAMISKPDFDPNTIDDIYDTLVADNTNSNLVNRATSGLYTPGSTFKLFTLYEYMQENDNLNDYSYYCDSVIYVDDFSMSCANKRSHGYVDLKDSFAYSCNTSFVNLGLTLNKNNLKKSCEKLYFNKELPVDFDYKQSQFVLDNHSSVFETMQTVIGQGKTLVTPLHLCMIASSIANNGVLMKPHMVKSVDNNADITIKSYSPEKVSTLFTNSEIQVFSDYMRAVVTDGTARDLESDLYTAYGKTGTAQLNVESGEYNSVFMGYAENNGKKIAICVVLEDMPEGSTNAVPIAKAAFDEYFN